MSGNLDIEGPAKLFAQIDPHIIALQEVDELRPRSNFIRQTVFLARELGMNYVFGPATRYPIGAYGNALLSKFPFLSSSNHPLPSKYERRAFLEAQILLNGQVITVITTHLGLDSQERTRQLREFLLPLVKKQANAAVLLGDFNAPEDSKEIKMVARNLHDTFKSNSGLIDCTFPSSNPHVRIDYIFINSHCKCDDFYIVDSQISDHLPAVANIII
ncbi:MAG: hypothetical protein GX808_04085 [Syntrophomonadaceae bacterium]|nr:hypothetical protein [Syntrophomonadaceae bacterium]